MVVDIGGGTTEIAVMSLGGVVYSKSLRVAGDALDQSIIAYMRKKMNLMIGDSTAEKIKKEIGTAIPSTNNTFLMKGRDIRSGTPKEIELTEKDACEALMPILNQILGGIKEALENTPPELSADLIDMGLVLTGGGGGYEPCDFGRGAGKECHASHRRRVFLQDLHEFRGGHFVDNVARCRWI